MSASNTQFSIAVHLMASLGFMKESEATSRQLAKSINTSPSFIRRILSKLSKAGLVDATPGKTGACRLGRKPKDIFLLDIYKAVGVPRSFSIHDYPAQKTCLVSCHIKISMEKVLNKAQKSFEEGLNKISLAQVIADIKRR